MNLPYSPSLLKQVGFYTKRLRQEESIRKVGFIIMAIAFFMQVVAFMQPPKAAIATSPENDFSESIFSRSAIQELYSSDDRTKQIYGYYGINPAVIETCSNSDINPDKDDYIFVGLQAHGANNETTRTNKGYTFYERNLSGPSYRVFECQTNNGPIFINLGSGNPIITGKLSSGQINITSPLQLKMYVRNEVGTAWLDANSPEEAADSFQPGDWMEFKIDVTNTSQRTVNQIFVDDAWHFLKYLQKANEPDWVNIEMERADYPWDYFNLNPGATKTFTYKVRAAEWMNGQAYWYNFATIDSYNGTRVSQLPQQDRIGTADVAKIVVGDPHVEVELKKQVLNESNVWVDAQLSDAVDTPTFLVGDQVQWRVIAENLSTDTASGITVSDEFNPSQLELIGENLFPWNVGTLQPGESKTSAIYTTTILSDGPIQNTATITNINEPGDNPDNNSDPAWINTRLPNVEISLKKYVEDGNGAWADAGSDSTQTPDDLTRWGVSNEVDWRIVVKAANSNEANATNIVVNDTFRTSDMIISGDNPFPYSIAEMDPGEEVEIIFTTKLVTEGIKQNVASVTLNETTDNPDNNEDPAYINVAAPVIPPTPVDPVEPCVYNNDIDTNDSDCQPCPINDSIWHKDENCKSVECSALRVIGNASRNNFALETESSIHNGNIQNYTYLVVDVDGNEVETIINQNSDNVDNVEISIKEPGVYVIGVAVSSDIGSSTSDSCSVAVKVADAGECRFTGHPGLTDEDEACVPCPLFPSFHVDSNQCNKPTKLSKTASNVSKNIIDANGTTADAGDTITYTLTTTNLSTVSEVKVDVVEKMSDVLEYAELKEYSDGATLEGKTLNWGEVVIPAGESVEHVITVQIFNEIPSTGQGSTVSSDARYDLNMNNVYGNAINIKLDPPTLAKQVEGVVTSLPKTGAGTTTIVAAAAISLSTYFYARARQLRKELDMVRHQEGI